MDYRLVLNSAYGAEPYWIDYCLETEGMRVTTSGVSVPAWDLSRSQ